jgi:hypothetical protein
MQQEAAIWQMMLFFDCVKECRWNTKYGASKEEGVYRKGDEYCEKGKIYFSANKMISNLLYCWVVSLFDLSSSQGSKGIEKDAMAAEWKEE